MGFFIFSFLLDVSSPPPSSFRLETGGCCRWALSATPAQRRPFAPLLPPFFFEGRLSFFFILANVLGRPLSFFALPSAQCGKPWCLLFSPGIFFFWPVSKWSELTYKCSSPDEAGENSLFFFLNCRDDVCSLRMPIAAPLLLFENSFFPPPPFTSLEVGYVIVFFHKDPNQDNPSGLFLSPLLVHFSFSFFLA